MWYGFRQGAAWNDLHTVYQQVPIKIWVGCPRVTTWNACIIKKQQNIPIPAHISFHHASRVFSIHVQWIKAGHSVISKTFAASIYLLQHSCVSLTNQTSPTSVAGDNRRLHFRAKTMKPLAEYSYIHSGLEKQIISMSQKESS